jgi:hypothetical protein
VLESQPQRTTGMTARPLAATGIDVALLAAHKLLNNPPSSGASPSAAEQWRHDVDQLIIAAINMPHHTMRAPSIAHAPPVLPNACPSAQCRAPMSSYTTTDLREEINRCRGGEDNLTAIEDSCRSTPPPKKYDKTVNPTEFLQINSTAILTAGGDEAIMANYFPITLTGRTRSWLLNLPEGTLDS